MLDFIKAQQYLSAPRLGRYLAATNKDPFRAIDLYEKSLEVAASFHPLLGTIEVVLRNRLDSILTAYFKDPSWVLNQKGGFMAHPSLIYVNKKTNQTVTDDFLRKSVEATEKRLRKLAVPVTAGRVIADQSFSVWTEMFQLKYYRILKGRPIQLFSYLPAGFGRQQVSDALTQIRLFRNRINHNESICFVGNTVDFTATKDVHKTILVLLSWIDKDLLAWASSLDKVPQAIRRAEAV